MSKGAEERLELLDAISDLLPKSETVDRVKLTNAIDALIAIRIEQDISDLKDLIEEGLGVRP